MPTNAKTHDWVLSLKEGIDTCKEDGGSPLTCRQPGGPWVQAGIVSWGIGCGENNIPAVYANVASASCWIDNMVRLCFVSLWLTMTCISR